MSIRTHLTRLLLLTIVPLVLLIGAGLFAYVRTSLVARFDDGLLARARALSGMVKLESGAIEFDFAGEAMPQYERVGSDECFQLWTLDDDDAPDRMVERSGSLGESDIEPRVPRTRTKVWDAPMPGGQRGRYAALRFAPQPEAEGEPPEPEAAGRQPGVSPAEMLIVAGQSRRELDRTLSLLAAALAGAGAVLVGGVLLAVRVALEKGLSPLGELAAQVEAVRPEALSVRIAGERTPDELAPIVRHANGMLDRLAAAFEREKRLAASAAHELRTPIAEMRAVTELALSRERSADEYRAALEAALAAAKRMGAAADAVLRLARVQSGRERLAMEAVDVREVLIPAWERWIAPLSARGVRVAIDVPRGVFAQADRAMLGVVFENLCANAAEHTPAGEEVSAACFSSDRAGVVVRISNAARHVDGGPTTAEAPTARVDGDEAVHAGLGLVIARSMIAACGGTLEAEAHGGRFIVSIHLGRPAAPPR